ncbi:ABC transporter permease [uncultured Ruthenibacterium sp.]|uniref:ABC transporter permease n=1 Tax=uncultured Ruthenibacterium sp. TaxID=1905347 RepID=UPI00349EFC68
MSRYILKRLGISAIVILLVSIIAFTLVHILPGDPAVLALGSEASEQDLATFRERYYLDRPVVEQYFIWMKDLLHGNLGDSIAYSRPVLDCLVERLPRTISIGLPALILSSVLGILCGIVSAVNRGKFVDNLITFLSTIGLGAPQFWLGIVGIYVFGMKLGWLPLSGYVAPSEDFGQYLYYGVMPICILSFSLLASVARQTRSNMLEVINQDYIRTARANGLANRSVIYKHALKNALIPVITTIGLQVRVIVGGSLMVEQVFNIAGIGTLIVSAINGRDYMVVQGCVFVISVFTVLCNLVIDLLYGLVDPRIRKSWR